MPRQKSYYELLKDPRWQRKRLEIMECAHFSCEWCGADDKTLNIHHTYYEKGCKPWEYPDESLLCLCEPCHEEVTQLRGKINRELGQLSHEELAQVYGYIQAIQLCNQEHPRPLDCQTLSCASGVSHALDISEPYVEQLITEGDYSYRAILKFQHMTTQDMIDMVNFTCESPEEEDVPGHQVQER